MATAALVDNGDPTKVKGASKTYCSCILFSIYGFTISLPANYFDIPILFSYFYNVHHFSLLRPLQTPTNFPLEIYVNLNLYKASTTK